MIDLFGTDDKSIKKDKVSEIKIKNVLFDTFDKKAKEKLYVVIDEYIHEDECYRLKNFIEDTLTEKINLKIIYPFKRLLNPNELEKNIGVTIKKNRIDLSSFIPEGSNILSIGRGIYTLTNGNTDIMVDAFYDTKFNLSFFFNPETKSYVFPVDDYYEILNKDCYKKYFAKEQIKECRKKIGKINYDEPDPIKIFVHNVNNFLNEHKDYADIMAIDTESSGFNFQTDKLGCVTISFDGIKGYYLRWKDIENNGIEKFNEFIKNKKLILANAGHDIRFLHFRGITNHFVYADTWALGHFLNEMRRNNLKAHAWFYTTLGGYDDALDDYKKKYKNLKSYLDIPEDLLSDYATLDAIVTMRIFKRMNKQLNWISKMPIFQYPQYTLATAFWNIRMPAARDFLQVELDGLKINKTKVREVAGHIKKALTFLDRQIYKELGFVPKLKLKDIWNDKEEEFVSEESAVGFLFDSYSDENELNISSNEQLGIKLEQMGWPCHGRAKPKSGESEGVYLVNTDTLRAWKNSGYKLAGLIIKKHEFETLNKNFIGTEKEGNGIWKNLYPDGKVHGKFFIMLANSTRSRSKMPNLQNFPARGWKAKWVRKIFEPDSKDFNFLSVDYSGLQMYIATIMSGGDNMRRVIQEHGGDFHTVTAHSVFYSKDGFSLDYCFKLKKEDNADFKDIRFFSKSVNFGFLFLGSEFTFLNNNLNDPDNGWSDEEVMTYVESNKDIEIISDYKTGKPDYRLSVSKDIRKKFFETYPELKEFAEKQIEFARKNGYVISPHGVIRRLPQLKYRGKHDSKKITSNLESISINSPVQAVESYVIQRAMININKGIRERNYKSRLFGFIHDAEEFMIHQDDVGFIKLVKEESERMYPEYLGIKLEIEGNEADYFGKAQAWDCGSKIKNWSK